MNLSELFIRRPVMTVLLSASLVVAGLFAYNDIPIAALPKLDTPTISVTANLPGTSPENMASSVAPPLEKQFATISGVNVITSSSTLGNTQVSSSSTRTATSTRRPSTCRRRSSARSAAFRWK